MKCNLPHLCFFPVPDSPSSVLELAVSICVPVLGLLTFAIALLLLGMSYLIET